MNNSLINIGKEFIKVIVIAAIAVPTVVLFAAWTGPTTAPPGGNAEPPINVSDNAQEKKGDLTIHRSNGGFDVGLFTTDILSVIGGAIFNKNNAGKEVTINTEGNVGIGTVSPQTPAPNNQKGNVDVNDVWVRGANAGTGQWVSEMSGGGSMGLPGGYEFAIFPLEARIFKIGTMAKVRCQIFSDRDFYINGEAKHDGDGKVRTRAYTSGSYLANPPEAGNCDSGWVIGVKASCTTSRPRHYTVTATADTTTSDITVKGLWNTMMAGVRWSCEDKSIWQ